MCARSCVASGVSSLPLCWQAPTKNSQPSSNQAHAHVDPFVFTAVLAAAAFHAGWNALLKLNVEPIVATSLVAAASGLLVLPLLPSSYGCRQRPPGPTSWPR